MKEIKPEELQKNPFQMIGKEWLLVTAEKEGKTNTMTASWGGVGIMWGKPVAYVFIRPQRYTKAVSYTHLDADLEEERRMFYVAMTRAKKELTICWAKKQFSHELTVSRFVEEMKDDRAV